MAYLETTRKPRSMNKTNPWLRRHKCGYFCWNM